jgi:uncharacterized protein (TIGR00106 family)
MSVLAELSIFPMDQGISLSPFVSRAVTIIRDSGLAYRLGPMGTSFEGDWEKVMSVVDQCYRELSRDSNRVYLVLKIDAYKGRDGLLEEKVESVQEKLP